MPHPGWFYVAAAVLLVAAVAFAVVPLLRSSAPQRVRGGRREQMKALYHDRLAELEAEADAGQVEAGARGLVMDELGANLLDDIDATTEATALPAAPGGSWLRPGLIMVVLPLLAVFVYLTAGEPDAFRLAGADEILRLDPATDRERIEFWAGRLDRRVESRDEDGASWYLLGVARLQLGEFAAAAEALGTARELVGSDLNVNLYWLQARYLAAGGRLDERSQSLATEILEQRPNHPMVLELFALQAYRAGEFRMAVELLNRALSNPLPAAQREVLQSGLDQARSHMGMLTPTIDVAVDAPPEAPRRGTLFVIARPPGGGMPYGVVRRPADDLPVSVRLDDTVSMSGLKLSNAPSVQVVVRLSRSGQPTAAAGDWEWQSATLDLTAGDQPLTLQATLAPRPAAES